ncbi:MAG: alanine--glyoxylate aminotransferase family protein [Elusimicrobia bacterium]|nr:alanine--glyoxylate aminotransferase family protein [Elusimicrobiota bacterium]
MPSPFILLTPGPTPIPPSVLAKLAEPILHHRTVEFGDIFIQVLENLQYVFRTKNPILLQTTSGTGGMESAVANLLSPGDKTVVAAAGAFGNRWTKILKSYGLNPILLEEDWGRAIDPEKFKQILKTEGNNLKAVFLTHTETSTGVVHPIQLLSRLTHEHSDALVVVDSISGLGGQELETDAWDLDVVVSASQKGLMNAPGLAFVSLSEKAQKAMEASKNPRFYWDWRAMKKSIAQKETPYTPSVSLVVAQSEALRLIKQEGIQNIWKKTSNLAGWTREELKKLGFPNFPQTPCDVLSAGFVPEGADGTELVRRLLKEFRVSIADGQDKLKGRIIRVAHMGYIRQEDIQKGLTALSSCLHAART